MKTMPLSEFKAKCIAVLKEIRRTREPLTVTLRGQPLATVGPAEIAGGGKRLGTLRETMTIHGDLVRIESGDDWEMLR